MSIPAFQRDHIDAYVPHDIYRTLAQAAELTGLSINQFLVQAALKEARTIIEGEQVIPMSESEWRWLLDLLDNPPEPNVRLKAAFEHYRQALPDFLPSHSNTDHADCRDFQCESVR